MGCLAATEVKTLDYLLRSEVRQIKSFTFSLLNTLATFQDGKKYLLAKTDLIELIVSSLTAQTHANALNTLPLDEMPNSTFGPQDSK